MYFFSRRIFQNVLQIDIVLDTGGSLMNSMSIKLSFAALCFHGDVRRCHTINSGIHFDWIYHILNIYVTWADHKADFKSVDVLLYSKPDDNKWTLSWKGQQHLHVQLP